MTRHGAPALLKETIETNCQMQWQISLCTARTALRAMQIVMDHLIYVRIKRVDPGFSDHPGGESSEDRGPV
jgi:hypothetical protein